MQSPAARSVAAKGGWTLLAGELGLLTPQFVGAHVPASLQVIVPFIMVALVTVKNIVATFVGDPNTTHFDGPIRSTKHPLKGMPLAQLDQVALAAYEGVDGVQIVTGHPGDQVAPHGVNFDGETDKTVGD